MELYEGFLAVYYKDDSLELKLCRETVSYIFGKVICNQKYGKGTMNVFQLRTYKTATTEELITIEEDCKGDEEKLSDCKFKNVKKKCPKPESFDVQCRSCGTGTLIAILNSLKIVGRRDEIHQSVSDAWTALKNQCGDGFCGEGSISSEYCKVKALLLDTIDSTKPDPNKGTVLLQTSINYAGMLKDNFMKEEFSQLKDSIFQLGDQIGDFQTKLSKYFANIAEFDLKKATADEAYSSGTLKKAFDEIKTKQDSLKDKMKVIAGLAGGILGADLAEKVADLAIMLAFQSNPGKWLTEDGSNIVLIKDTITDILKNSRDLIKLGRLAVEILPALQKDAEELNKKLEENADNYDRIRNLIKPSNHVPFTLETSKKFLKEYNDYSPPITPKDITKLGAGLEEILDFFCSQIEDTTSATGATIGMGEAGDLSCYKAKTDLQIMMSQYEHIADLQLEVMESFAQMARARVAAEGARNLGNVLKSNLNDQLIRKITQWDILFQLRQRKINIIRLTCDQISYMNGGKYSTLCENLILNPDLDASVLRNTDINEDKCRSPKSQIVTIPARYITSKDQLFKEGMLDITGLFKRNAEGHMDGESEFHIPSKNWLLANGWISSSDSRLLYLKKLQIFIPTVTKSHARITVEAKVTDNIINEKNYMLENGWRFVSEYSENAYQCENKQDNLYNFKGCGTQLHDVCTYSIGTINGPFYPLITAKWKITVKSSKSLLPLFLEENTPVHIKAIIEYCSGTGTWPTAKRSNIYQK